MVKGKSTWKYNKLLTGRRNYFSGLEEYPSMMRQRTWADGIKKLDWSPSLAPSVSPPSSPLKVDLTPAKTGGGSFLGLDWSNPFKGVYWNALKSAGINAAVGMAGQIGGGLIGGGLHSGAGNVLQDLSGVAAAIPGPWGAVASAGLGVLGGLTNRMFGSKMNTKNIAKVEANINNLNSFQSNASDFDSLTQNWANADVGMTFRNSFIGKDGWFSHKAKNKAANLRRQIEAGNAWVQSTLNNNAENISTTQMQDLLANYAALGGPLFFAEGGGIHIKPENRGKFTETKRRTGKTTEELTHSKNPLTRKRAIFAQNAKKWHHAFGGDLMTHGANFDTGVTLVGNGNTHENNPYEGVPMGVDPEGTPNLVEEGEVIFNDYVFSNRLKVPKAVRNKYKLRGNKSLTFADAALQMSKESEERPNDPISQTGLEALLGQLASVQEEARERRLSKNTYAYGGVMANVYDAGTETLNRYPGGQRAVVPYDWTNFIFNGQQLYDPTSRQYSSIYNNDKFKKFIRDNWESLGKTYWNDKTKVPNWHSRNSSRIPTLDELLGVSGETPGLMYDAPYGNPEAYSDAHNFGLYMLDQFMKQNPSKVQYKIRQGKGKDPIDFVGEFEHFDGDRGGYTWDDIIKDHYKSIGKPVYDSSTNTFTHYYDPIKKKNLGKVYFRDSADSAWSAGESQGDANKRGVDWSLYDSPHEDEDGNMYYTKLPPSKEMPVFDHWARYASVLGPFAGLMTGIFSKPDESGAEAILEASRGAGAYQPIRFKPVGNYLTYKPFDTEFAANQANAEAAAARRAIMNTAGGNRAQAIAGILAANNNALNQLGVLRRGAAEDNFKQRQSVEDFNRATNMANSKGFLDAAIANQQAAAQSRELSLKGTIAAEESRQRARLAHDNAIQANLSNLFTSIGNIGQERVARQQMKWMVDNGYVPGYGTTKAAKDGKIKRRKKGLTY